MASQTITKNDIFLSRVSGNPIVIDDINILFDADLIEIIINAARNKPIDRLKITAKCNLMIDDTFIKNRQEIQLHDDLLLSYIDDLTKENRSLLKSKVDKSRVLFKKHIFYWTNGGKDIVEADSSASAKEMVRFSTRKNTLFKHIIDAGHSDKDIEPYLWNDSKHVWMKA